MFGFGGTIIQLISLKADTVDNCLFREKQDIFGYGRIVMQPISLKANTVDNCLFREKLDMFVYGGTVILQISLKADTIDNCLYREKQDIVFISSICFPCCMCVWLMSQTYHLNSFLNNYYTYRSNGYPQHISLWRNKKNAVDTLIATDALFSSEKC